MKKNTSLSILLKGIIKENPVFVLILGTCPTLAVTNNVAGAFGMGIAALAVLVCSNVLIPYNYLYIYRRRFLPSLPARHRPKSRGVRY